MKRIDRGLLLESTGRVIDILSNDINLTNGKTTEGYDNHAGIRNHLCEYEEYTRAEKDEIASYAINRWMEWAAAN